MSAVIPDALQAEFERLCVALARAARAYAKHLDQQTAENESAAAGAVTEVTSDATGQQLQSS